MKEIVRIFLVIASGGTLFAITFLIACFALFGDSAEIHWATFVKIAIFCIVGLGIAFLIRDKDEKRY